MAQYKQYYIENDLYLECLVGSSGCFYHEEIFLKGILIDSEYHVMAGESWATEWNIKGTWLGKLFNQSLSQNLTKFTNITLKVSATMWVLYQMFSKYFGSKCSMWCMPLFDISWSQFCCNWATSHESKSPCLKYKCTRYFIPVLLISRYTHINNYFMKMLVDLRIAVCKMIEKWCH